MNVRDKVNTTEEDARVLLEYDEMLKEFERVAEEVPEEAQARGFFLKKMEEKVEKMVCKNRCKNPDKNDPIQEIEKRRALRI